MFHKHNWGKWYFEDEVSATIRHCLKCGKREYRKEVISKVAPGNPPNGYAKGGYVKPVERSPHFKHAHWALSKGESELRFYAHADSLDGPRATVPADKIDEYDANVEKILAASRKHLYASRASANSKTIEIFQKYLDNHKD